MSRTWDCRDCGLTFRVRRQLRSHRQTCINRKDDLPIVQKFELTPILPEPIQISDATEDRPSIKTWVCRSCDQSFRSRAILRQHRIVQHCDERPWRVNRDWPCSICSGIFPSRKSLRTHRQSEHHLVRNRYVGSDALRPSTNNNNNNSTNNNSTNGNRALNKTVLSSLIMNSVINPDKYADSPPSPPGNALGLETDRQSSSNPGSHCSFQLPPPSPPSPFAASPESPLPSLVAIRKSSSSVYCNTWSCSQDLPSFDTTPPSSPRSSLGDSKKTPIPNSPVQLLHVPGTGVWIDRHTSEKSST